MITRRQFLRLGAAAGAGYLAWRYGLPDAHPQALARPLPPSGLPGASTSTSVDFGPSKIGVHVVIGRRDGYGTFLQTCAAADQPVPIVKCVDDFGAAAEAKQVDQRTVTVGRVNALSANGIDYDMQAWEPPEYNPPPGTSYTNAQEAAQQYYDLVRPKWRLNPAIDIWETFNEFSAHWSWQADFFIALMDLAEADGFRLGLYGSSTGNPPRPEDPDGAEAYPAVVRACQRAKSHGNHVLTLHEYGGVGTDEPPTLQGTQPDHALRYRTLYATLKANCADCPLIISECGQNGGFEFIGITPFIQDFEWYDSELNKDAFVIGATAWTLGNWAAANIYTALPALAEYIVAHALPMRVYLPLVIGSEGTNQCSP